MSFWEIFEEAGVEPTFVHEQLDVHTIRDVVLEGAADIFIRRGPQSSVHVAARNKRALEQVKLRVQGQTLIVDSQALQVRIGSMLFTNVKGAVFSNGKQVGGRGRAIIGLTLPELNSVTVTGAGDVFVTGLQQANLQAEVRGAGNLRVSGKVKRLHGNVSGAGHLDAQNLIADEAELQVGGAGRIYAQVRTNLNALIRGVGEISVAGSPSHVKSDVTGLGLLHVL